MISEQLEVVHHLSLANLYRQVLVGQVVVAHLHLVQVLVAHREVPEVLA